LSAALLFDEQIIEAIYYENTEEEFSIPNIKAVDERGYRYNIETEVAYNSFDFERLLYQ
jgi:hypothetical protein